MAKSDYIESSGNVFADLEIPNSDEMLAKAELAQKIADIVRRRRLTQVQAAAVLGVDQPKVSALIRGCLSGFSIERLLRFLLLLGTDVAITLRPRQRLHSRRSARTTTRAARFSNRGSLSVVEYVLPKHPKATKINTAQVMRAK